ncbi:MAG: amidohydrolase [Actinobacteria bacterium]|nr:amidohydrolase [Actinomycetota bacterium]
MTFDGTLLGDAGSDVLAAAVSLQDSTIELRRTIHADPELGLDLPRTQKAITEALTGLGLDITLGEQTTSVVADLDTGRPGPTVLLRGDMDALPLQEDYVTEFQSRSDGKMHACGHDSHVAMLASAARLLSENRDSLTGRVRFMFQPGEEGYGGAEYMIREGVLDGVDRAFAIHISPNLAAGLVSTKGGALLASSDEFEIVVAGKGGHASAPHQCVDPIPAAAATITGIHTMVGRSTDATRAGVVTVAQMRSGTTNNIIAPSAYLAGTIRAHDEHTRSTLTRRLAEVANGVAAAHGCTCTTQITPGYPVTINDEKQAALVGAVAAELLGADLYEVAPSASMAAEDFSYVLQRVPGAMATLGVCPDDLTAETAAPCHSNLMRINEAAFSNGVALHVAMALAVAP